MRLGDSKNCVSTSTAAGFIVHVFVFLSARIAAVDVNQSRRTACLDVSMKLIELSKKGEDTFFLHNLFTCTEEQLFEIFISSARFIQYGLWTEV
jgi:hypothetical protein